MLTKTLSLFLGALLVFPCFAWSGTENIPSAVRGRVQNGSNPDFALQNLRLLQQKAMLQQLQDREEAERARRSRRGEHSRDCKKPLPAEVLEDVRLEAGYILSSQYLNEADPAHGAINNVNFSGDPAGEPTWIVPRENGLAILGLIQAFENTGDRAYLERAELAADYLVRVQDADGGWFDQYAYAEPVTRSKSPTQTAEVMMALAKLGYSASRYEAMKKGAQFLMTLQDPANKQGADDGLISGGIKDDGTFHTWRWTSDNSFAYLALKAAEDWAGKKRDKSFAKAAGKSAERILNGINKYLYVSDESDADYGVWRRVIDENGTPVDPGYHEWINYAPQMLDLPAKGVGNKRVGEWIHATFQKDDGSVVWDDGPFSIRKSPGFSFQASLVWLDLGQKEYADAAIGWAKASGLWQETPDFHGISGGWIDWTEGSVTAQEWERFIDTSFYAAAVFNGGYDFR